MRHFITLVLSLPSFFVLGLLGLPVIILMGLNELFFCASRPFRNLKNNHVWTDNPIKKEASIIILNWNGRNLLKECLPSVIAAVEHDANNHEVLVVDNGSTDDSIEFLRVQFPQVRVVSLDKNYGFVDGYNRGVRAATKDVIVFLNNDMLVKPGFLDPLLDGFTASDVFAVSAQIHFWDPSRRREETGKTRAVWNKGWVHYWHDLPTKADLKNGYIPVFWLGGGSAAVDRKKFLALGGFNASLTPFYMEDVDLSYRAWKRGWKVLFCPASEVIHKHRASTGRLNKSYVERVIQRNRLLFLWENITDPRMLFEHFSLLPLLPLRKSAGIGWLGAIQVLVMALGRLPQALLFRNKNRVDAKLTDREVFSLANSTFAYKDKYLPVISADPSILRILFVCPYFPSFRSGGGVRMYKTIQTLAKRHEVSLLSFWDEESDCDYMPHMEKICKRMVTIRRRRVPPRTAIQVFPPAIETEFGDPQFRQALEEMLGDEEYDILQAEFLQMAIQIPQSRRIPIVLTHHEVQNAAIRTRMIVENRPLQKVRLASQWAQWLNAEISLCRFFDRVVALTPEDAWNLYRYAPDLPLEVIPTGIDLEYFQPVKGQEEPNSLIFVGNFRHSPNVDSVLFLVNNVLPLVAQQIPDVKLYVVGANPPQQIQNLAQPSRIIVTGWVEDMRPFVQRSCVYVFPIRTGVGLRNKILEAWAMGKPTITTRLGSAGLQVIHGENLWLAESAEEFASGICSLLNDFALRDTIGKNARRYVEQRHAWHSVADKYEAIYRKVLHERRGG